MEGDDGANDGVSLPSVYIQDHEGKKSVQNIQAENQYQKEEQHRAVPVDISPFLLLSFPANRSPPTEESIPAQTRSRFLSSVCEISLFLIIRLIHHL